MSFGKRLKEAREQQRLTQEQFAELGGVKRVSQHLYEQDARVPDLNYLYGLERHGIDIGRLIFGDVRKSLESSIGLYVSAFRTVDEFARDEAGELLPYPERERFFTFLCATASQNDQPGSGTELRERLVRFMRA